MAGYVRQSAASIITGAVILAAPLNAEFNQLQSAFNGTTGHAHTGGAGDAPKLSLTAAMSGVLPIANGGTNAITAAAARITLGLEIGTNVQAYDADLDALAANATNGFWARTNTGTGAARTLTAPAAGFTITNPAGIAGNPTFVLANDLAALEALASNGIVTRTASETYALRTLTGTAAEVTVTNGDGVSGNPTISIPAAVTLTGKTITGGTFASPTISGTLTGPFTLSGTITGGTHSGAAFNGTLGATTPSTGVFTTLTSNTGTLSVTVPTVVNNATFTATDPGSTGSIIVQYHNSASPANSDIITYHQRLGNSSTAVVRVMAADFVTVTDTTNTSEDATWTFQNIVAGSLVTQMNMTATGMQIPAIGATTPGTGAFTTLSASGTVTPQALLDISGASAGQISFPATQNASAGANVLDDYEEGTWTPLFSVGGSQAGVTYASQTGRYTKIGRLVTIEGSMALTNNGSATGAALIEGLPFTVGISTAANVIAHSNFAGLTAGVTGIFTTATTTIELRAPSNTGSTSVTGDTMVGNAGVFFFGGSYSV